MKKKAISCMLALALSTTNIQALAATAEYSRDNAIVKKAELYGNLQVEVNFSMPVKDFRDYTLSLNSSTDKVDLKLDFKGITGEQTINIDNRQVIVEVRKLAIDKSLITDEEDRVYYYDLKFKDLSCDNYSLILSGRGISTVNVNNINLENYSKKVYISDTESFLLGDFDDNGKVEENDYKSLLNNITTGDKELIDTYDLNKDGILDIQDLSLVQDNLGKVKKTAAIIDTDPIVDTSKILLTEIEGQSITGDLINIFQGNNTMPLKIESEEEITEDNPAKLEMNLEKPVVMEEITIDSSMSSGTVIVETADGQTVVNEVNDSLLRVRSAQRDLNNSVKISLGKQVAVKKVTISITGTTSTAKLAEISKVQFLNKIEDAIEPPNMNIPSINVLSENESLTVNWNHEPNVTGYEVKAAGYVKGEYKEFLIQTTSNNVTFSNLENYNEYKISIQSLNGDWTSGFGAEVIGVPRAKEVPTAPEGVSITGAYKSLNLIWKENKSATSYNIYYREAGSTDEYNKITDVTDTKYNLTGLQEAKEYEVYLTGINDLGEGKASNIYTGTTTTINPPVMPKYKLINTPNDTDLSDHIVSVEHPRTYLAEGDVFIKNAVVDGDFSTSWNHNGWDTAFYSKSGPIITFDKEYTLDTIALTARLDKTSWLPFKVVIGVWNDETGTWDYKEANVSTRYNNGSYDWITLDEPITASKIQVNVAVYGGQTLSISELKFYEYDSVEDEVRNLFTDDLLVELNSDVNQDKINELKDRVNSLDEVSGEYHPNRTNILNELQLAEDILNDKNISNKILTLNQNINNGTKPLAYSNDYQSLGISVRAGEEIVVYVGTKGNSLPEIAFTQYYGESSKYITTQRLKKGKNVIQVPKIQNLDVEKGGSVYVRYTGSKASNNEIKIRVSGGTAIPVLNVYGLINDESKADEVKDLIRVYIETLQNYTATLEDLYEETEDNKNNIYTYNERTSVLNTTDIESQNVTLNLPATAILEGIKDGLTSMDDMVDRVYESLLAFEQLMDIKFAERGLEEGETPSNRVNIKYQRMFTGAFMYASPNHVGIEYTEAGALMQGKPYTFNEDGTVKDSGSLFGWGIAHEVGHISEITNMTYAETTNNIIALLAQTFDDKTHSRLETSNVYKKIYEKVTSNTVGLPSDVFTKLGMFWQLHLAYDTDYTSLMLANNNSYYAKLSKRYRELTDDERSLNTEQLLVRCASDAAGKNLSEFFLAWGIEADSSTVDYLESKGYEKETRKIQYLNDEARRQALAKSPKMTEGTKAEYEFANDSIKAGQIVSAEEITLNLSVNNGSDILGYEIARNGQVIGFTTDDTFTDYLGSLNNRAIEYTVTAYDNYLNKTESFTLGTIKVSHDGTLSNKSSWAVETNAVSEEDNNHSSCSGPNENAAIKKVIDSKDDTTYLGTTKNEDPYVIVDLGENTAVSGFKYKNSGDSSIDDYEVYVSQDKENWTLVNSGEMEEGEIIYFNKEDSAGGKQLYTYTASYVKLVAKNTRTLEIGELDIIAPPGDNINISNVGVLEENYVYDKETEEYIPKGSIVVTGRYRGNPIYNVALLRDENNNIIKGEQLLLAEVPTSGKLGEISSGTFMYYIPAENKHLLTSKVKIELYRVNDAETNEGQRLVSDSLYVDIPEDLPSIEFEEDNEKEVR